MKTLFQQMLNLGTAQYEDDSDKRRCRIFNFIAVGLSICIIPPILITSIVQGNTQEVLSIVVVTITMVACCALNWKGHNQVAVYISGMVTLISINYVVFNVPKQTGAPYGHLLGALCFIILVKKRFTRLLFTSTFILAFLITNYYQLKTYSFVEIEYIGAALVLVLFFLALVYYDQLMVDYQTKIKEQSDSLFKLEEEKHKQELLLKQKDMETILASSSVGEQLRAKITKLLKRAISNPDTKYEVEKVITELNIQNDLNSKLNMQKDNIEQINADFYQRLQTQFPTVTKAERELSAYMKLGLSNKEIANIKSSTENSVNVSKARLRKKLGISNNKQLQHFLFHF